MRTGYLLPRNQCCTTYCHPCCLKMLFELVHCLNIPELYLLRTAMKKLAIVGRMLIEIKIETPNLSIFEYKGEVVSFSSNALVLSSSTCKVRSFLQSSKFGMSQILRYVYTFQILLS